MMKLLLEEWLLDGKISHYCQGCVHFLVQSRPRIFRQLVVSKESPYYRGSFMDTNASTPVCNEYFYHDDGTPSNFYATTK